MSRFDSGSIRFQALEREFFRFLKDTFQSSARPSTDQPAESAFAPTVDVHETDEETLVLIDLPGIDPTQVEITVEGGTLTIQGTRTLEAPENSTATLRERSSGRFVRRIPLAREVDLDAASAEGRLGVLVVRLPRPAVRKLRTIPIQAS